MVEDALDSFEGPTTIRIFAFLLVLIVMLLFLGTVLAELYGITILQTITRPFAENPMWLLNLAGFIALIALLLKAMQFASRFIE